MPIVTSRRSLIFGAGASLIAAPAIVRAASLMPIRAEPLSLELTDLLEWREVLDIKWDLAATSAAWCQIPLIIPDDFSLTWYDIVALARTWPPRPVVFRCTVGEVPRDNGDGLIAKPPQREA